MDKKKIFRKSDSFVVREIEGEVILMSLNSSSRDINYIYTLNKTAAYTWSLIDGRKDLAGIKNLLIDRYEVEEAQLNKELGELIKDLHSIKAIS